MSLPVLLPLIVTLAGAHRAGPADERTFDRSMSARGIERVSVRLVSGSIRVVTTNSGQIGVHAVRHVDGGTADERRRVLDESRLDVTTRGGTVTLQDVPARSGRSQKLGSNVELELRLPESTTLDLHTDAGEIQVTGSAGSVSADTGAGTVRLTNLQASGKPVDVATGAGSITINGRTGDIKVKSGAGSVLLNGLACTGKHATVDVATGSIRANLNHAPTQRIILEAGVGPVTLSLPRGTRPMVAPSARPQNFREMGGTLTGRIPNGATFKLSTGIGPVRLK